MTRPLVPNGPRWWPPCSHSSNAEANTGLTVPSLYTGSYLKRFGEANEGNPTRHTSYCTSSEKQEAHAYEVVT